MKRIEIPLLIILAGHLFAVAVFMLVAKQFAWAGGLGLVFLLLALRTAKLLAAEFAEWEENMAEMRAGSLPAEFWTDDFKAEVDELLARRTAAKSLVPQEGGDA